MKRMGILMAALAVAFFVQSAQAQWTSAKRITWTSGNSASPAIKVDSSGHLHVVWADRTPGNYEVYYKNSTDGGTTWAASQRLTWTSNDSKGPSLAIDSSDHLHVVWWDYTPGNYEVYYKKSTDGGASWTTTKRITWTSENSYGPDIAVDLSDNLHVVWYDSPVESEIYYKKSTDGGANWTTTRRITWTEGSTGHPAISVDPSGHLHVVWDDSTPGSAAIYYKKSEDGGETWTASRRITWAADDARYPVLGIDSSGHLHVAWEDYLTGPGEICYKKSEDGGTTWTASKRLTWTSGGSHDPDIAVGSSGLLYVVWEDSTPGNYEIYCKKSTDGGATWAASQRLTWTSSWSDDAAIAAHSLSDVHAVWADEAPGNFELYYRRNK